MKNKMLLFLCLMTVTNMLFAKNQEEPDTIYTQVEQIPQFPGGDQALLQFLAKNVKYPPEASEHGIQGKVVLRFVVEPDGSITDIKVEKSVDPLLDKEAIRVVKKMPKWIPGRQNGQPVRVYYSLPIGFRLQPR